MSHATYGDDRLERYKDTFMAVELKPVTAEEFHAFVASEPLMVETTRGVPPMRVYFSADREFVAKKVYHAGEGVEYWIRA